MTLTQKTITEILLTVESLVFAKWNGEQNKKYMFLRLKSATWNGKNIK